MGNVIEHAFVVCRGESIETEHLPEKLITLFEKLVTPEVSSKNGSLLSYAEKQMIEETLNRFNGNRTETADALGIEKTTLWRKMKKLGLL